MRKLTKRSGNLLMIIDKVPVDYLKKETEYLYFIQPSDPRNFTIMDVRDRHGPKKGRWYKFQEEFRIYYQAGGVESKEVVVPEKRCSEGLDAPAWKIENEASTSASSSSIAKVARTTTKSGRVSKSSANLEDMYVSKDTDTDFDETVC